MLNLINMLHSVLTMVRMQWLTVVSTFCVNLVISQVIDDQDFSFDHAFRKFEDFFTKIENTNKISQKYYISQLSNVVKKQMRET